MGCPTYAIIFVVRVESDPEMICQQFPPSRRTRSRVARARECYCLFCAYFVVYTHARIYSPSAVDRARRDVARGMFGKQIDEHGHALKRMESDHTQWTFCSTTSQLARRAAEAGMQQQNAATNYHTGWKLISITDCKQQPHMGLKYRFRVKVESNGARREAELDVLWQSWHKPPYQCTRFKVGTKAKFSGHTSFHTCT